MSAIKNFIKRILSLVKTEIPYEQKKQEKIESYRKLGVKIGHNSDIIESTLDGSFPFLIEIGNDCILTGATILCHDYSHIIFSNRIRVGKVIIGDGCFIGRNSVIMPGVEIGDGSVIGVNSVVTKSIPERSLVVGSPARIIGNTDDMKHKRYPGQNCIFVENVVRNFRTTKELQLIQQIAKLKL